MAVVDPEPGDVVVHPVPDVLGRILDAPPGLALIVVIDDVVGDTVRVHPRHRTIRRGSRLGDPGRMTAAIAHVAKEVAQRPGVKPVFASTPPYAAPFLAPNGVGAIPEWCGLDRPDVDGLPDLVVVRAVSRPPPGRRVEARIVAVR